MNDDTKLLLRNILAIVAGVLLGGVAIMVVQMIGHQVYPVSAELDVNDKAAMRAFVAGLPVGALLFVIVAYAIGSFVAGALAAYIGHGARTRHALVAGAVLMLAGIMNLVAIPHPVWFSVLTVVVFLPLAWLGARLVASAGEGSSGAGQSGG